MKDGRIALLGAICGDVVGSAREWRRIKKLDFELLPNRARFTDDTVMTCAVAEWLMNPNTGLIETMQRWGLKYIKSGYGRMFLQWITSDDPKPYNSFGNGSAMRVSPVGWVADTVEETMELAKATAMVSHNHPEGVKGAQSVAAAIFLARTGHTKEEIKEFIEREFPSYDLCRSLDEIRPKYRFDSTCQGSVPESIIAFLESTDYESAIRNAISLGGDADTMGAISGSIAAAFYKEIPDEIATGCMNRLTPDILKCVDNFSEFLVKK